jgi:predicted metal-dependent hydrolase
MVKLQTLDVEHVRYPVKIYYEYRQTARVSIGRSINIRLPKLMSKRAKEKTISDFLKWAKDTIIAQPKLTPHRQIIYQDGDVLRLQGSKYTIQIFRKTQTTYTSRLNDNSIIINVPETEKGLNQRQVSLQVSKVLAKTYIEFVRHRLDELNDQFFKASLGHIRLKYATSIWGSCSSCNNINISTRVLFLPVDVADYIYIHELAHLIHHNHSREFWSVVAGVCPEFREKKLWLRNHGESVKL